MNYSKLCDSLVIEYKYPGVEEGWIISQRSYSKGTLIMLSDEAIQEALEYCKIPKEMHSAFYRASKIIKNNDALERLFWHCINEVFVLRRNAAPVKMIPRLDRVMGEDTAMFRALLILSGVPFLKNSHRQRNIPDRYTRLAFRDITIWMKDYYRNYNSWGLDAVGWLLNPFRRRLFRIGRLEFIPSSFDHPIMILKHRENNDMKVMIDRSIEFRGDGYINGVNGIYDAQGAWLSDCIITEQTICGNIIDELGRACREPVLINRKEYEIVLDNYSLVLDVHIPEDGTLDKKACQESYSEALSFFYKYYPDENIKGFKCTSWLLDSGLIPLLPEESNILLFQNEYMLFPTLGGEAQTLERVFRIKPFEIDKAPQVSRLQKSLLSHLKNGEHFHSEGGILLSNTVMKWNE